MQGVLHVQIGTLLLKISYGKFCFVNYLVSKRTHSEKKK